MKSCCVSYVDWLAGSHYTLQIWFRWRTCRCSNRTCRWKYWGATKPPLLRRDGHTLVSDAGEGGLYGSNQCHIYLQKSWSFANKNKDLILKKQWFYNIFSMAIATNLCATLILFCVPVKCEHAIMVPPPPPMSKHCQKVKCTETRGTKGKIVFFIFVCKMHIYFVLNTFICKYMWHWFDSIAFRMYLSSVTHTRTISGLERQLSRVVIDIIALPFVGRCRHSLLGAAGQLDVLEVFCLPDNIADGRWWSHWNTTRTHGHRSMHICDPGWQNECECTQAKFEIHIK